MDSAGLVSLGLAGHAQGCAVPAHRAARSAHADHPREVRLMKVCVLGGIRIGVGGEPSPVSTLRHQRIVAGLVLAGPQGLSVDSLAARVWDADETPTSPVPTRTQ